MIRVYLSGPITGLSEAEYTRRFATAERHYEAAGYEVVNPTRFYVCKYIWLYRLLGYRLTLLYDLWRLMQCDLIYKLPGWPHSKGANIESCVTYHMKGWPMSKDVVQKIDKRMEKLIIKLERQ